MEQHILERIRQEFRSADRNCVLELLASYSGPESDRVRWDILELTKGKVEKITQLRPNVGIAYIKSAQRPWCSSRNKPEATAQATYSALGQ